VFGLLGQWSPLRCLIDLLMATIPLDRRFNEWCEDANEVQARRRKAHLSHERLAWSDLLAKRRVVILAEAGSGKTAELIAQAKLQTAAGKIAFYATVQDVGREGLERALRPADRDRLQAWRVGSEPAWFFIDSIDEAKFDNIKLERALRQLSEGIASAAARAHIVLSGRHTDWEFARDARRFNEELPLSDAATDAPLPTLEEMIQKVLRNERPEDPPPPETSMVVVMAPLDSHQVRAYASGKGVPDVEKLMGAIDGDNLWAFAKRPLDLDWIVRHWRQHGRLGSLASMIDESLNERIRETDPERARRGTLDQARARQALERIGAAMVLGRKQTIAIPDMDAPADAQQRSILLEDVLIDWSPDDRTQLLTRPAFDPATYGRARLHNDNEGVVRSFLAASWLYRLCGANLSQRRLHDLLFTQTYGIDLVRPSLMQTAAWLSLWDDSVATEVLKRAPHLLFTAGDPASLSASVRRAALLTLVERTKRGEDIPLLDQALVTRFAQPDIVPTLREVWAANYQDEETRLFVLRLIWLGRLRECLDLAEQASFGRYPDRYTTIISGRALLGSGDERLLQAYADYIKRDCALIATTAVWEAVDDLFPRLINVDDLLKILASIKLGDDEGGGFSLDWNGKSLVERLTSGADADRLIEGLLAHLAGQPVPDMNDFSSPDAQCAPALAAAAARSLELSAPDSASAAALDAMLHLSDRKRAYHQRKSVDLDDAARLVNGSAQRRQTALWHAADRLAQHEFLNGRPLQHSFQLQSLGWGPTLVLSDVEWLLADGPHRTKASERRLAINAALTLWLHAGNKEEALRARIQAVADSDAEMREAFTEWVTPRVQSAEEIKMEQELAEMASKGDEAQAKREQSWFDLVSDLRADPGQLRNLVPTSEEGGVDTRIYNLWRLLSQATRRSSNYAIDSVAPIATLIGEEVAAGLLAGLSEVWRAWSATLHSDRPPAERNLISTIDCLCIAAVSLEAANRPGWAASLAQEEAVRAARIATLEINGFPKWLFELAGVWPGPVAQVLAHEAAADLDNPAPGVHHQILEYIDRSPQPIAALMWPHLHRELLARPALGALALRPLLPTLLRGVPDSERPQLCALAIDRFNGTSDPQISAQYLGVAYALDASKATDALTTKLDLLGEQERTLLVERVLPHIFGSHWSRGPTLVTSIDLPTLERLVVLAYRIVKPEEDRDRANGGVYSPDERDMAEAARSSALEVLIKTPGQATFDAINRMAAQHHLPFAAERLRSMAHGRAAEDAEDAPWLAGEVAAFEETAERRPATGKQLQVLAMQRLADMQHDLIHGDFQQGRTLSALDSERAVQNWLADRLRHLQGTSYSIEREPHVADEKEPDLRFRARVSDASVATEIKVAWSWSLKELEDALVTQLCGRYLRARDGREGILLLVNQKPRPKGWELPDGTFIDFNQVVEHLRAMAATIRGTSQDGPQPEICAIDVSSCSGS